MIAFSAFSLLSLLAAGHVHAHASIWHPSMYGFNVTAQTFPYDNRPVAPLVDFTFEKWWFHGHLGYPPNAGDLFQLPAGKPATSEIACNKGATSYWASDPGGNIQSGNNPCPGSDISEFHTTGPDDLKGCALAIAYQSDVNNIQPEDFVVFSVNQTCVWNRFTDFQVPSRMPPCPEGGCHCAWFWIHSPDSGSEQNYMTGFRCNITGSTSNVPLAKPQLPRRCGADPPNNVPNPTPGNCTYGAKSPFYWDQAERNNMYEGIYSPPFYNDLYNFRDGAQDDIFQDSYDSIPPPSPNQTAIPQPKSPTGGTSIQPSLPSPTIISLTYTSPPNSVASSPILSYSYTAPPPSSSMGCSYATPPSSSLGYSYTAPPPSGVSSPLPASPPPVTVTTTLVVTVTSLPNPTPSSGNNTIGQHKRKPMPMKRMITNARRHWGSRRSTSNSNIQL